MHQPAEHSNNCTFCPHCVYEQTATCAAYIKKLIGFITEKKNVNSAVRTGLLNEAIDASSFKG
jgi:hypothetical protein